jgi:hypothetical protein
MESGDTHPPAPADGTDALDDVLPSAAGPCVGPELDAELHQLAT